MAELEELVRDDKRVKAKDRHRHTAQSVSVTDFRHVKSNE